MTAAAGIPKHYLVASDFDQTLSFNDSGVVLSELIGASGFHEKVHGLARSNLVQQGGELAYLIRHDPEFRGVRREHLQETGRRVRLRSNIPALVELLEAGFEGYRFSFFVISAAPREVIQSALEGIVSPEHIIGTELEYDVHSGEVRSIVQVPAGYGKVAALEDLEQRFGIASRSNDLRGRRQFRRARDAARQQPRGFHHRRLGEQTARANRQANGVERRCLQRDGAGARSGTRLGRGEIRSLFESNGLTLQEWERARTDRVIVRGPLMAGEAVA